MRLSDPHPDARLLHESEQLATRVTELQGPGAGVVRAAARQLVLALELYQQQQRRLDAERFREPDERARGSG